MDTIQIMLLIVLSLTTILLTVVGIQLIFVLSEARKALKNVNKIIQGLDAAGIGLQHGLGEIAGFVNGFKSIMKIVDIISHQKKNETTK